MCFCLRICSIRNVNHILLFIVLFVKFFRDIASFRTFCILMLQTVIISAKVVFSKFINVVPKRLFPAKRKREFCSSTITKEEDQTKHKSEVFARNRFAIFGLGNYGASFTSTRHNFGARVLEALSYHLKIPFPLSSSKHHCSYAEILEDPPHSLKRKIYLVQPQSFMNVCGHPVRTFTENFKILHKNVIVVYDDLDLSLGTVRLRNRGSDGGHNGLKSVTKQMGRDSRFIRVRLGIGRPENGDIVKYVLNPFREDELKLVALTAERAAQSILTILNQGLEISMNQYNKTAEQFMEGTVIKKTKT